MGSSSYAFKISATIIKPSRESILDYCCYLLIILSLIGIARVWIGGDALHTECSYDELASSDNEYVASSDVEYDDDDELGSGAGETATSNITRHRPCPKSYQAMFAYILLIESIILLLVGILWVKAPKVNVTLKKFSKLVRSCRVCGWAKQALKVLMDSSDVDMSLSLQSFTSGQNAHDHMCSLLDRLFHPDSDYRAKANARHLYEKVQFYVKCSDDPAVPCNHDIFLRVIWFMSEFMLIIYAVFNCKTLKWINEHSTVNRNPCCSTLRCIYDHTYLQESDDPLLTCRPYRYGANKPVYNDTAIILHLFEESHPKLLPYFIVFMFDEWKDKLSSFPQPTHLLEVPGGLMRILSGRPPPVIEITEIPLREPVSSSQSSKLQVVCEKSNTPKKAPSVKFYVGVESCSEDDQGPNKRAGHINHSKDEKFNVFPAKCKKKGIIKSCSEKGAIGFKATDSSSCSRQSSMTSRESASSSEDVKIPKTDKLTPVKQGIGRLSPGIKLPEGSPIYKKRNVRKPQLTEGIARSRLSEDDRFSQGDSTDDVKSKDTYALLSDVASSCDSENVSDAGGDATAISSEKLALLELE